MLTGLSFYFGVCVWYIFVLVRRVLVISKCASALYLIGRICSILYLKIYMQNIQKSTSPSLEQLAVWRRFVDLYRTDVDLYLFEVVDRYSVRAFGRVDISILRGMNYRSAVNADSEKVLLKSLQKYTPRPWCHGKMSSR